MAIKPSQVTRRNFLQRAGLLVSTLGVNAGVQAGLIENLTKKGEKKWGREAMAQTASVKFVLEINARAGLPLNVLFGTLGDTDPTRKADRNVYASQANVMPFLASGNPKPAYIMRYPTGLGAGDRFAAQGGDLLLQTLQAINASSERFGLATCESVALNLSSQHDDNFRQRAPTGTSSCVASMAAKAAPARPVPYLKWNTGGVTDQVGTNGLGFQSVSNQTGMLNLIKEDAMFFTLDEAKLIWSQFDNGTLATAGAIDNLDDVFAVQQVPGMPDFVAVSRSGRNQATLSFLTQVQNSINAGAVNFNLINDNLDGVQPGMALNSIYAMMKNGITTSATVNISGSDWHSVNQASMLDMSTSRYGMNNRILGNAIAGFLKCAADPVLGMLPGGGLLIDNLLILMGSEFGRTTTNNNNSDNGDGGSGFLAALGSKVKTGAYGDILGPTAALRGFDPNTGATLTTGANITQQQVWKATGQLAGIPDSILNMDVAGMAIPAILKP